MITATQILNLLLKAQKLNITTEISEFNGDFMIHFTPEIVSRTDLTDSIMITKDGTWMGYGWTFENFMRVLDERLKDEMDAQKAKEELDKTGITCLNGVLIVEEF